MVILSAWNLLNIIWCKINRNFPVESRRVFLQSVGEVHAEYARGQRSGANGDHAHLKNVHPELTRNNQMNLRHSDNVRGNAQKCITKIVTQL